MAKPFALPAECLISRADALKSSLAGLLGQAGPVTLDASDVRRIDSAAAVPT